MAELFIGVMSGTSLDGVDGVVAEFDGALARVRAHAFVEFAPVWRAELLALNRSGHDELHRAALAGNALVRAYASVVQALLASNGWTARDIRAIGAHGQTVRHQPGQHDGTGYTVQLNQPALLAELTGVTVVADFRSRDVAAGGQGAPLTPVFHRAFFGCSEHTVAVLNLGGIANLTVLAPGQPLTGFDCGPANVLLDGWCERHTGRPFDHDGAWAASGHVSTHLLRDLLNEPFFLQPPPKSTGRDRFHLAWLDQHLAGHAPVPPQDVQATLVELTARACGSDLLRLAPEARELVVCGGGALNGHLMQRLQAAIPDIPVRSSQARGLPPLQVEAAAFAWLARQTLQGQALDLSDTTGARGARVLGAIYPA